MIWLTLLVLSCRQHPLRKAGRLPAQHCPHVVRQGSIKAHQRCRACRGRESSQQRQ